MPILQVISEISEFMALKDAWNELAGKFATPLLRHEWFTACWRAFVENSTLSVFVVRVGDTIRAIAPLVVDRSANLPRLRMLGHQTTEPNGFLYADEESLGTVCSAILDKGLPVALLRLRADADEIRSLRTSPRAKGIVVVRPNTTATARVSIVSDWKAFQASMPAKSRTTIRQRLKSAERVGPLTFRVTSPDETTVNHQLGEIFQVEAAGWKSRTGTAILKDLSMNRFCTEYGRTAAKLGILRLFSMQIGGVTAAVQMAVEYAGRLWYLKQGYDEKWAKFAPGILLTHETLRYACERELVACEFLGGAETWQRRWPIELDRYSTFRFYPRSITGILALGYDTSAFAARRMTHILRPNKGYLPTS